MSIYPVPNYERFFTNMHGELFVINVSRNGWRDISKNYNISNYKSSRHDGLSDDIVINICEDYINNNNDLSFVYNKYGHLISKSAISSICRGDSHKDITSKYILAPKKTHISRDTGRKIRQLISEGYDTAYIINLLSVMPETVNRIRDKMNRAI